MNKNLYIPAAIIGVIILAFIVMIASMSAPAPQPAPASNQSAAEMRQAATAAAQEPHHQTPDQPAATATPPRGKLPSRHNNTRPALITLQPMPTATAQYSKKEYKTISGRVLTYYMLEPQRPYPEGIKFPLTILLHGEDGLAYAGEALAEEENRLKYPSFVIAPLAPEPVTWASPDPAKAAQEEMPFIIELLKELVLSHPVDQNRIYIAGCSAGAIGAYGAIADHQSLFAGALVISGDWVAADAPQMTQTPLLIVHGAQDTTIPVENARKMAQEIQKAGHEKIFYIEDPHMTHTCSSRKNYEARVWDWLYAQHKE